MISARFDGLLYVVWKLGDIPKNQVWLFSGEFFTGK
jgi:hypothetical protein